MTQVNKKSLFKLIRLKSKYIKTVKTDHKQILLNFQSASAFPREHTMIDDKQKEHSLAKIINSNIFADSEKYCALLIYLVQSTLQGKIPKEYTIAIDVFNKDKNFNPSEDTIVRYYMHRLRKKIREYYDSEGKNDELELIIPKGHYQVKFQYRKRAQKRNRKPLTSTNWLLIFLLLILVVINIFFVYNYNFLKEKSRVLDDPIKNDDPVWSDFFHNQLPSVLLIGDHYMYDEFDTEFNRFRQETDFKITSRAEFNELVKEYPNRILQSTAHGSIPHNSLFNLNDIYHVFVSFGQKPNIEFTSEYMYSQFNLVKVANQNIIYMGGFRNLRELNIILSKLPIKFEYTDTFRGNITIRDAKTDSLMTFQSRKKDEDIYLDYGVAIKVIGAQNEVYLFLMGFAYPAQIEVVRMVSQEQSLASLYDQYKPLNSDFPDNFVIVLEVLASEFTALETNIRYFSEIPVGN